MGHFYTYTSTYYSLLLLLNGHYCYLVQRYVFLFMVSYFHPTLYNKQLNNYHLLTEFFTEYGQSATVHEIWNKLN